MTAEMVEVLEALRDIADWQAQLLTMRSPVKITEERKKELEFHRDKWSRIYDTTRLNFEELAIRWLEDEEDARS